MSVRKVNFAKEEYYHIYNRGNSKQKIFHDKEDYFHFMNLLFLCNDTENLRSFNILRKKINFLNHKREAIISIGSYCLMPNHFHILITEQQDGGISKFMQKLATAYVMYYNQKYERTGSLFEGKFKSKHLSSDRFLKYLFSYIHLNPVKLIQKDWKEKGIKNKKDALVHLDRYQYSSFLDFMGLKRIYNSILDKKQFPEYFPIKSSFTREIFEWLSYSDSE